MILKYEKYIKSFAFIFVVVAFVSNSFAATLQLHRIGVLDLGGKTYPEWWYTGVRPTLYGVGANSTNVDIKIGENTYSTTSNSAGAWEYATQIDTGDYNIEISQGSEKLSFTLHLGQSVPENTVASTQEATQAATNVPTTGFNQYVALSFGMGVILLATYFYFSTDTKKKSVFENRMLKED
jgi:hypothetical protein